jgi:hypothetical protein
MRLGISDQRKENTMHHTLENVEIFVSGKHNGDVYSESDLDAMVEAFGALDFKPPLKSGHSKDKPGMPALGWVSNLRREGRKLIADFVDLPSAVYEAIKSRSFDTISAEIFWGLERAGKKFHRALKAVALLGADIPAVAGLKPLHEMFDEAAEVHYTVGEDVHAAAKAIMDANPGIPFMDAFIKALENDSALKQDFLGITPKGYEAAGDALDKLARQRMTISNETYRQAFSAVLAENPSLKAAYTGREK